MSPPEVAGWNLALRFGLEVAALFALAIAAWTTTTGPMQWAAVVLAPAIAVVTWGVFNVVDDPSRSGQAPIEVPGWIRLAIELAILGGGAAALAYAGQRNLALGFAFVLVLHYTASWSRVRWLLNA